MAKKNLTKEQKKMSQSRAVSGNGTRGPSPYYPTDYTVGKRNPKKEEKPMVQTSKIMTAKEWAGIIIILMIPLVNIIALIAWSRKKNERVNPTKRNFAKAYLIIWLISLLIAVILTVALTVGYILLFPFPTTPEDATALLEENNYTVEVYDGEKADMLAGSDAEYVLIAKGDGEKDGIMMIFFANEDLAKEFFDTNGKTIENDYVAVKGKVFFAGSKNAAEAINALPVL